MQTTASRFVPVSSVSECAYAQMTPSIALQIEVYTLRSHRVCTARLFTDFSSGHSQRFCCKCSTRSDDLSSSRSSVPHGINCTVFVAGAGPATDARETTSSSSLELLPTTMNALSEKRPCQPIANTVSNTILQTEAER